MKDMIIKLRKEGKTYKEISEQLNCAKSTISYHCKNEGLSTKKLILDTTRTICPTCGNKKDYKSKECNDCRKNRLEKDFEQRTLAEAKLNGASRTIWSAVRARANNKMERLKIEKRCKICNILEPIECCHIKGIAKFSETSLVSEVNHIDNLVYLCRNHHWLFDHNKLTEEEKEKFN